jgi:hypothetical protein
MIFGVEYQDKKTRQVSSNPTGFEQLTIQV